jgi:hypothetical protein
MKDENSENISVLLLKGRHHLGDVCRWEMLAKWILKTQDLELLPGFH